MSNIAPLIGDLGLILVVAGIVTLLFKRLKQPLVLGYIVAGFLVGPNMPYTPSIVDRVDVQVWADIGVIFLLFSMGLDFSFKKIFKLGTAPFIAVLGIVVSMFTIGYTAGWLFGWTSMERIFLASVFSVCSSSTIVYKTFNELKLKQQRFASLVLSVLVIEDVLSIVIMVMLSAIAGGDSLSSMELIKITTKIAFFIILWFVVGIYLVPIFLRKTRKLMTNEILLVVSLAMCFFMAIFSAQVGFSSAFGAFVMGSILAETVDVHKIIKVVEPIKDLFGAVFFVSVGMLVDVKILIDYALPILSIVALVIVGQAIFGTFSFMLSGNSLKTSMQSSFSMAQIGEFPFIIASLGVSLGVIGNFMYPVIVAASAITTFLTPYVIKSAVPVYNGLERVLPRRWMKMINHMNVGTERDSSNSLWKPFMIRMLRTVVIYSIISTAVISLMLTFFLPFIRSILPHWWANAVCGGLTLMFIASFLRAIVLAPNHSAEFKVLWNESHKNRLPLTFMTFVRIVIAVAFTFYICNYLSRFSFALMMSIALVMVILMLMSRRLKSRTIRMERQFVENLRARDIEAVVLGHNKPLYARNLQDRDLHIADFEVPENSIWIGKTLEELQLASIYGIQVSSILRGKHRLNIPGGATIIYPGDVIQAIGSDEKLTAFHTAMSEALVPDDLEIEMREMKLKQLIVEKDSYLIGKTVQNSGIRDRFNCMIVGFDDGNEDLTPAHPTREFKIGDVVWLVGEQESLKELMS